MDMSWKLLMDMRWKPSLGYELEEAKSPILGYKLNREGTYSTFWEKKKAY